MAKPTPTKEFNQWLWSDAWMTNEYSSCCTWMRETFEMERTNRWFVLRNLIRLIPVMNWVHNWIWHGNHGLSDQNGRIVRSIHILVYKEVVALQIMPGKTKQNNGDWSRKPYASSAMHTETSLQFRIEFKCVECIHYRPAHLIRRTLARQLFLYLSIVAEKKTNNRPVMFIILHTVNQNRLRIPDVFDWPTGLLPLLTWSIPTATDPEWCCITNKKFKIQNPKFTARLQLP